MLASPSTPEKKLKRHRCNDQDLATAFEGPEKLLEFWFGADGDTPSLRTISKEKWQSVLDLIHCQVVASSSNEHLDAYVLSESSMFVYPRRVILKTCGTTTLLNCIEEVLHLAAECGMTHVEDFFYSRQTFFFPDRQLSPHKAFTDEVSYLDKIFDKGAAFVLGRLNDSEHYNIYNAMNDKVLHSSVCLLNNKLEGKDTCSKENGRPPHTIAEDFTVEIMMSGLDVDKMKLFFNGGPDDFEQITKESGIADLFPGALLNGFLFSPCGYSLNGLVGDGYFTIHITPEDKHSYASFETNMVLEGVAFRNLIYHVLALFRPRQFMLVTWATRPSLVVEGTEGDYRLQPIPGYLCGDQVVAHFQRYRVNFTNFKVQDFVDAEARETEAKLLTPRIAQSR